MADTVPAAEFARNFGRYKMQAQREAVPVSTTKHWKRAYSPARQSGFVRFRSLTLTATPWLP